MTKSLSIYKFTLNKKGEKSQLINLNEEINGQSILNSIGIFLHEGKVFDTINKENSNNQDKQKHISLVKYDTKPNNNCFYKTVIEEERDYYNTICLTVSSGITGDRAEIYSAEEEEKPTANIYTDDSIRRRFQIMIAAPCDDKVYAGVIIFLNIGKNSIVGLFKSVFTEAIKLASSPLYEITIKFSPLVNQEEFKKTLVESKILELSLIKYTENDDALSPKKAKVFYNPKQGIIKSFLLDAFINKKIDTKGIAEIESFMPDDIKVTLNLPIGKNKTIGFKNFDSTSFVTYINEETLEFDSSKFIIPETIYPKMHEMLKTFIQYLNAIK